MVVEWGGVPAKENRREICMWSKRWRGADRQEGEERGESRGERVRSRRDVRVADVRHKSSQAQR